MPCYSVYSIRLDTSEMDIEVMRRMMERMGHQVTQRGNVLSWRGGSLDMLTGRLEGRTFTEEQIVMGYAEQTVLDTCEEYGWTAEKIDQYEYNIVKE